MPVVMQPPETILPILTMSEFFGKLWSLTIALYEFLAFLKFDNGTLFLRGSNRSLGNAQINTFIYGRAPLT